MSQESSRNALQRLMLLPTLAKERFQKNTQVNQSLSNVAEGQNVIIEDLTSSIPDLDETMKKIKEVDDQIKEADQMLTTSNEALLELISNNSKAKPSTPGPMLSSVLNNVQNALFEIALEAAGNGKTSVNLLYLIDVEDQVSKLIEDMTNKGMYPEAPETMKQRIDYISQHNRKIVQFLELLKGLQQQQQQQQSNQE